MKSTLLSSKICYTCNAQLENIRKFKDNLISTQNFLLNLLQEGNEELLESTIEELKLEDELKTTIKDEEDLHLFPSIPETSNHDAAVMSSPSQPQLNENLSFKRTRRTDHYPE